MKKEASERYQAVVDKLKKGRHKLTPQRLAIVSILTGNEDHPSVEDICRQLQKRFPGISQATVYRNIMLIRSLGEVLEIGFAAGSSRYDGRNPRPHPHVVCLKCRKIIDSEFGGLRDITKKISDESGFEIVTYRLDFFGLCPDCRDTG